jgi:MFS family permease
MTSTVASPLHTPSGKLLLLSLASYFFVFFHRAAPSTLSHVLKTDFHLSNTAYGWLGSIYFYIYALMQVPTGVWVDRKGTQHTLIGGTLLSGIGSLLFSFSSSFPEALISRGILGLGVSVILVSCLRLITLFYPPERFSTLSGMVVCVGTLGAIAAGLPLDLLLHSLSWRWIHAVIGSLCIICSIALWLFFKTIPSLSTPHTSSLATAPSWLKQLGSVAANTQTWYAFGVSFFIGSTIFGYAGLWAVRFLVGAPGATSYQATLALSFLFGGFGVGGLAIGAFSTHIARRKPPIYISACFSILLTALLSYGVLYPLWVYDIIYFLLGFFGAAYPIAWSCAKENNPSHLAGMATSLANMGSFLGAALIQPLMGWMLDHWGNHTAYPFKPIFLMMLCAHLLSLVCVAFIRETHCKNRVGTP